MESVDRDDIIADNENIQPTDDCNICEVCDKSFSTKPFLKQHLYMNIWMCFLAYCAKKNSLKQVP